MNITFESKTYAECADFLKLLFKGKEYTLDEFSAAFKKKTFDIEQLLAVLLASFAANHSQTRWSKLTANLH